MYARNDIIHLRTERVTNAIYPFSQLGSIIVMKGVFLFTTAVLLMKKQRLLAVWMLGNIAASYALITLLKTVYARPRPVGGRLIEADGFNFPSGNAFI
ncbi:hypothetical protein ACFQPF_02620 [Fictibacillus iocasae]|uniref:Uncharacterized protein n=1 Tax=Fictibacillus iocasae TaxID=2715437 RepID=A0ABW2NJF6_9BACL